MELLDLKRIRREACITQSELANRLGYPQPFLSQIEHGKRPAPNQLLKMLAVELNISNIDDYIKEVPDPPKPAKVSQDEIPELKIQTSNPAPSSPESSTISQLVELLAKSQERIDRLEKENKRLMDLINEK